MSKVIIVGGGASGLMCALNSKTNLNEVTILERNSTPGKKILIDIIVKVIRLILYLKNLIEFLMYLIV